MNWIEIAFKTDEETAEVLAALLEPYAYQQSVAIEQLGNPEDLDPFAMLPEVFVKIYLPESEDSDERRQSIFDVADRLGIHDPRMTLIADEDWANAWKQHYAPFRIGDRFYIQPTWERGGGREQDIVITLDPGMAFGTGLHETTQLCLEMMPNLLKPGMRVLDLGTGTAILAIAAIKLGAAFVDAIDIDPVAIEAAEDNCRMNGVSEQVNCRVGSVTLSPKRSDIAFVNILARVIMPMLIHDQLLGRVPIGHQMIFSGIVESQREPFIETVIAVGGRVDRIERKNDWIVVIVTRMQ